MTALGRALGLPKSSAHRLLAALCRRGLVERDERGRYQPGIALVALGLGALEREPLVARRARGARAARPRALGETVFLVGARAGRLYVLDKAEGTGFLRAAPRVGEAVPVHATARRQALPRVRAAARRAAAGAARALHAEDARDARRALERAVEAARAQGYAENRDEWIPGLSVVAAPILARGELRGALAVAAPTRAHGRDRPRADRAAHCARRPHASASASRARRGRRRDERRPSGRVWIDGKIVDVAEDARIPMLDHGLLYGDGIFEGMRIYGGRVFRLDRHLARLAAGARAIALALPGGTRRAARDRARDRARVRRATRPTCA